MHLTELDIYKIIKNHIFDSDTTDGKQYINGVEIKSRFNIEKSNSVEQSGLVNVIPNTLSIFIKAAEKPMRLQSGEYVRYRKRIVFNLYTNRGGEDQVMLGYELCNFISDRMNKLIRTDGIIDSQLLIDTNYVGLNNQGVHGFSLEYIITY